ncbi:MAG: ion transporter [Pseudomonadota bacterium]
MERARIWRILEGADSEYGQVAATAIGSVIFLGAFSFALGTLPNLHPGAVVALTILDALILGAFAAEYVLRVCSAPRPIRYAFGFWGLVDLAAFLPALVAPGVELQAARLLRLILFARILKLMRITHAFDILFDALADIWDQLLVFTFVIVILLFLSATGIYYAERAAQPETFASIPHAMWWAVVTFTTVGYGDAVPVTPIGKLVTGGLLLIGLAVVAVPTGLISAALVSKTSAQRKGKDR